MATYILHGIFGHINVNPNLARQSHSMFSLTHAHLIRRRVGHWSSSFAESSSPSLRAPSLLAPKIVSSFVGRGC